VSSYRELLARVRALITPEDVLDAEQSMIDLPAAFTAASSKQRIQGVLVDGWHAFNRAICGFRPHEITCLCGPTGSGKTTLLGSLFLNFIAQGVPSFCAPVEVGQGSFVRKLASIASGIPVNDLDGRWDEIRAKHYGRYFSNTDHALSIYESHVSHLQLMADILHAHETRGTKIVLVDNLNFMTRADSDKNETAVVNQVIQDWIRFIKCVPVHVVMVTHPKKTEGGRVESEFDIKGSSTIVQEAQNVILFNRLTDSTPVPPGLVHSYCRELKIAKCRENGRAWGTKILLSLDERSESYYERGLLV
jgi:archaellum biogenesis ATPase FlaH